MTAHRARLLLLTAGVLALHLWLAGDVLLPRLGEGDADSRPRRIEMAFVRELAQARPPAPAAAPAMQPAVRRLAAPAAAASAASAASAPDLPATDPPVAALEAVPEALLPPVPSLPDLQATASPAAAAVAAAPASAPAAAEPAFEWPPSTRLSYRLTGWYRGAVEGQARVEWLRSGSHYQVFMDLGIGPSFAPLVSRRVSSDGEITAEGLSPRRYDEETRAVLRDTRRLSIFLDPDRIRLPGGREVPRPPAVQDSASQFVQLTWLFTTQPQRLTPGSSIDLPLALPRLVEVWTYDVVGTETLVTPAGAVETVHVKPRREPRPGMTLTAEMWVAPSLQYLPVRILIHQDAETYIDLLISRLPEQAEAGRTVPADNRRPP